MNFPWRATQSLRIYSSENLSQVQVKRMGKPGAPIRIRDSSNNQINARALISQSAVGYCAG